jgi:hypothetical protein
MEAARYGALFKYNTLRYIYVGSNWPSDNGHADDDDKTIICNAHEGGEMNFCESGAQASVGIWRGALCGELTICSGCASSGGGGRVGVGRDSTWRCASTDFLFWRDLLRTEGWMTTKVTGGRCQLGRNVNEGSRKPGALYRSRNPLNPLNQLIKCVIDIRWSTKWGRLLQCRYLMGAAD